MDAGAHTSSAVRVTDTPGDEVVFNDTPLAFATDCLLRKKVRGNEDATEEHMYMLEAVRRVLLRVEAAHAVSWLWLRESLLLGGTAEVSSRTAGKSSSTRKTSASGTQLRLMLPCLRRRRQGVLLAPLLR